MQTLLANTDLPEVHLIVVDDDHDDCALVRAHFEQANWHQHIQTLTDSDTLFSLLEAITDARQLPSVIALDYNMPRLGGETLLLLLKRNPRYQHIAVVMYSTSMSEHLNHRLLQLGAHFCRQKPSTIGGMHQLLTELQQLTLSLRSTGTAASSEQQFQG